MAAEPIRPPCPCGRPGCTFDPTESMDVFTGFAGSYDDGLTPTQRLTQHVTSEQAMADFTRQRELALAYQHGRGDERFDPTTPHLLDPEQILAERNYLAAGRPGATASRVVDLGPWLDGTRTAPEPSIGIRRDDAAMVLYPARWHTCIGLTEAGKSWWALCHAVDEIQAGRPVIYAHFEESDPGGTIDRLRQLGLDTDSIRKHFHWLDCGRQWLGGEFAGVIELLIEEHPEARLLVLDGINAACSWHGQFPEKVEAVGWYHREFVAPATRHGLAVLSLGHPTKSPDRQRERHGFGSTGWLDQADGAAFRMEAGKHPIGRGISGTSRVYVVKDRYGQVRQLAQPRRGWDGWAYLGSLVLDDTPEHVRAAGVTGRRFSTPQPVEDDDRGDDQHEDDPISKLAGRVLAWLKANGGRAGGMNALRDAMRAGGEKFRAADLRPALLRLLAQGQIEWPEVARASQPRPMWVVPDEGPREGAS